MPSIPAPAALFVVHSSGRLVGANQYACRMLGYEREELLELAVHDLGASLELESLLAGGEVWIAPLRRRDGTTILVRCQARPAGSGELRLLTWLAQPLDALSSEALDLGARHRDKPGRDRLTPRELEILKLMAEGLENTQISQELHISRETVKTHVRRLLRKLRARSRTHAVALAFRRSLIA